jgi:hypothetical protein
MLGIKHDDLVASSFQVESVSSSPLGRVDSYCRGAVSGRCSSLRDGEESADRQVGVSTGYTFPSSRHYKCKP